jgi:hypothetical protein
MSNILLVEPDYKNKFPPIGLMKIATYHRRKGDHVEFYKGKAPYIKISNIDRIYITTLFTFYYDISINTIKHYLNYINKDDVFVGGIAATLLASTFKKDVGINNLIEGQLTDSSVIGFSDKINIDNLPLDYDILDDISYEYPAGDNFFIYTTRGCPRNCPFCAVHDLEPEFIYTNNLVSQISNTRNTYGDKRNVLVMDNNILYALQLESVVNDLNYLGFINNTPNFVYPSYFNVQLKKIERRRNYGLKIFKQENELLNFLKSFKKRTMSRELTIQYDMLINVIEKEEDIFNAVLKYKNELNTIIERYRFKTKLQRYVDFNQGLDSRLLNEKRMKILSNIPIKPLRLSYDNIKSTKKYTSAFNISYKYGIRYYSNYILYNYKDSPQDLWKRLYNTIKLYETKSDIQAFSFPMKYAPINIKDRDYVSNKWNKKYLSALNVILNVTKGVVARELEFFYKAYGKNEIDFIKILTMPNEFIKHRLFFEKKGYINIWENLFGKLSNFEQKELIDCLNEKRITSTDKVLEILKMYKITKNSLFKYFENDKKNVSEYVS